MNHLDQSSALPDVTIDQGDDTDYPSPEPLVASQTTADSTLDLTSINQIQ